MVLPLLGTNVEFRGTVSDADHALGDLTISWISDKDGTLGNSIADSSGEVIFNTSALTSNSHVITLQVEDPEGDICTSNVLYSVGSPPTVTLYEPGAGTVHNLATSVYFEAWFKMVKTPRLITGGLDFRYRRHLFSVAIQWAERTNYPVERWESQHYSTSDGYGRSV